MKYTDSRFEWLIKEVKAEYKKRGARKWLSKTELWAYKLNFIQSIENHFKEIIIPTKDRGYIELADLHF